MPPLARHRAAATTAAALFAATPLLVTATAQATPEPAIFGQDGGNSDETVATVDNTSGTGDQGVAAEAVSSVQPARKSGPIGLLALVATVCVAGASIGVIRAIIAQRATQMDAA